MRFKIYQPYYEYNQQRWSDAEFEPFDNTTNPAPHFNV
jgi:hypothetical protein